MTYIIKKFFKAVTENPLLLVEVSAEIPSKNSSSHFEIVSKAFYPKSRGKWKQFSSWEPEQKGSRRGKDNNDPNIPTDVQVKKGYSWSEQLGIAIACLVDNGQQNLIDWVKEV